MNTVDVSVLMAVVGIAAALSGTLISSLLTMRSNRLQWEREDRVRYNTDRVQTYASFVAKMQELSLAQIDLRAGIEGKERASLLEQVQRTFSEALALYTKVLILASPAVREHARDLWATPGEDHFGSARDAFFTAVRKEIGVL
jgi:hypothetical protein